MNLDTLVSNLRAQAKANSKIVLDDTVFSTAVLNDIRTAFALPGTDNLTINGVTEADIPDPQNGVLTITAGTASLLSCTGVAMNMTFTVPVDVVEATLVATMASKWVFTDSFSSLTFFPFAQLAASDVNFVFATSEQTAYSWPDDASYSIALAAGLNMLSQVALNNFSIITAILNTIVGSTPYKFYGPFSPAAGAALPVGTLAAPLGDGTFDIGVAPFSLTLSVPSVEVEITQPGTDPQEVDFLIASTLDNKLDFSVGVAQSGDSVTFTATPPPGGTFTANDIIAMLPGGEDFESYIPSELSQIFAEVGLNYYMMVTALSSPKVTYLSLSIGATKPWQVIDELTLEELSLLLSTTDPGGTTPLTQASMTATAEFLPTIFTGEFDFEVSLIKQTSWEVDVISGKYMGGVTLAAIVEGLLGSSSTVPSVLQDFVFSDFGVIANESDNTYSFYGNCSASFPMLGSELTSQITLSVAKTDSDYTLDLSGSINIGEEDFYFSLDISKADSQLTASWKAESAEGYLQFEDIAEAFGFSVPTIPSDLDLALESASFTYDFTDTSLALDAVSANYGDARFVSFKQSGTFVYLFGLTLGKTSVLSQISLTKLPLIGDKVPESADVSVEQIRFLIASAPITKDSVTTLTKDKLIPDGYLPADGLTNTVSFNMELDLGGHIIPINLATSSKTEQSLPASSLTIADPGTSNALVTQSALTDSADAPPTKWIVVQKTFGPVTIQKIGIRYKDNTLFILSNLAFSAGGLTLDLLGIGIGSPLKKFEPTFTIDGLELTFVEGPIEISGGLYGTLSPINFYGEVLFKIETLMLSALGGYAEVQNHPSFFAYLALDYPLGGPSFFFVTGLAAGFGFNRKLLLPDINSVSTYPLVAWALGEGAPSMDFSGNAGTQASNVLTTLINDGIVAPSIGEDWLALGIRFSSFEVLDTFALVTVSFGNTFEVGLLGLSTLKMPTGTDEPVAEVQLAIKATFAPSEGLMGIQGQLTNNSYVLSRDAHLTGGFAYYVWFAGDHAGDFVVSMGGYSPNYTVPDYFPTIPRLGLNWRISSVLSITGDLYYALTSNAVMAGGGLSAVWNSGPIKAWFDVEADFLLVFKPFHYYISAGIDLGASFTINLLFTKISITIHIGVDLSLWGPDFQGKAKIDLAIISFTIAFGSGGQSTSTTIGWDEFTQQMLPAGSNSPAPLAAGLVGDDNQDNSNVSIKIVDGLTKQVNYDNDKVLYVINPQTFIVETASVIPSKTSTANGAAIPTTPPKTITGTNVPIVMAPDSLQPSENGTPITPNTDFGIGPTGTDNDDFESEHQLTFTTTEAGEWVQAVRVIQNVPKSLWEKKTFDSNGVPQLSDDALSSTTITNALTGYQLIPQAPKEGFTLPIELVYLQYTIDENLQGFAWSIPTYPANGDIANETVAGSIDSQTAQNNRQLLLNALPDGLVADSSIDVANLASATKTYLMAEPVFCLLADEQAAAQ